MSNKNLQIAKMAKNDEFYTMYDDIEKEVKVYTDYNPDVFRDKVVLCPCDDPDRSNFTKYFMNNFAQLGLSKLISTCYDKDGRGRYFTMSETRYECGYLCGNGDFRSDEITDYRNEADIIVTNPPFSLFRDFMDWISETDKEFLTVGNINACAYLNVFPLIMQNEIWLGVHRVSDFQIPDDYNRSDNSYIDKDGNKHIKLSNARWFTNIEHAQRYEPLPLQTMGENLLYSKHKIIRENGYQKYDNYDAIEVPYVDAIPADYEGMMGVPITFLDKYCPCQFEILGVPENLDRYKLKTKVYTDELPMAGSMQPLSDPNRSPIIKDEDDKYRATYQRIFIQPVSNPNNRCILKDDNGYKKTYCRIFIKHK